VNQVKRKKESQQGDRTTVSEIRSTLLPEKEKEVKRALGQGNRLHRFKVAQGKKEMRGGALPS